MKLAKSQNERNFFFLFWIVLTSFYFAAQAVWAQAVEVAIVTTTTLPPALPDLSAAQNIVDQLGTGWTVTIGIMIVELLMRTLKTQNPKSLLYVIANVMKMIAKVCTFLAELADKVLQRTKEN